MKIKNKTTNRLYWTFTGLFSFFMFSSAIPDLISLPLAVEGFRQIGLTHYLVPFLGVAKTLGVIAILIPGYPRLKEWAYAGLFFDLIGAIYLIIVAGKPASDWGPVFLPVLIGALSYFYYHKRKEAATSSELAGAQV
jgi:hypothetical protein